MRHEYIVEVDDTDRFYAFAFVGQIRGTCKQLVRCRDCEHYDKEHEVCCVYLSYRLAKNEDGFCSDAERKEE